MSTAIWVAQSLSSVTDWIAAALHVLPALVQMLLQDGGDPPADVYHRMPPTITDEHGQKRAFVELEAAQSRVVAGFA